MHAFLVVGGGFGWRESPFGQALPCPWALGQLSSSHDGHMGVCPWSCIRPTQTVTVPQLIANLGIIDELLALLDLRELIAVAA